jgi:hypothetical protein
LGFWYGQGSIEASPAYEAPGYIMWLVVVENSTDARIHQLKVIHILDGITAVFADTVVCLGHPVHFVDQSITEEFFIALELAIGDGVLVLFLTLNTLTEKVICRYYL